MRRTSLAAAVLLPGLLLAGCSGSDSDSESTPTASAAVSGEQASVDGVTVSGAPGQEPTITIDTAATPPDELVVEEITPGTGKAVKANSLLTVDYTGAAWSSGQVFDTSWGRGEAQFPLQGVIPGWQQGLEGVKKGARVLLIIPPDLAYGASPPPGSGIATDDTLVFVVDVKDVQS